MKARLVIAWAALLLLAACAETATAPAGPLPRPPMAEDDLWGMIPAEADLVLWADLATLRSSPWTRDSVAKVSEGRGAGEQLDHLAALDRVMFAKIPSLRDGASVLIAQGTFDRKRVSASFQDRGGTRERVERSAYRSAEMLIRGEEALAFLGTSTMLSGPPVAVRAAIDCHIGIGQSVESESWLRRMRKDLSFEGAKPAVAWLFVHLPPATREVLVQEMGEGGTLQDFGARVDLGTDLDVTAVGVVRTGQEAQDLAARLGQRLRDVLDRPIVSAFGLGTVIQSVRFTWREERTFATLHLSQKDRDEISRRMAVVAETLAKLRARPSGSEESPKENP